MSGGIWKMIICWIAETLGWNWQIFVGQTEMYKARCMRCARRHFLSWQIRMH